MRDWLKKDLANLPGVTTTDVDDNAAQSGPLRMGGDVANSHKHHTRKSGLTTAPSATPG